MAFATIRANFDVMWSSYPANPQRSPGVNKVMDAIHEYAPKATSCCIQLSSALNSAGLKVPQRSFWRENYYIEGNGWALGACDEVENFLTSRFGATENIKSGRPTQAEMAQYIRGRQGILVFRDGTPGQHTELWDGYRIRQKGGDGPMNEGFIFGQPRVLFWEVSNTDTPDQWDIPRWLQGWWYVTDGNPYWYYFDPQGTVHYVDKKPASLSVGPHAPENSGKVEIKDKVPQVIITWNPAGGGITVEKFSMWGNQKAMSGVSNRFAPLQASKIG
jgi:hypothetical protein